MMDIPPLHVGRGTRLGWTATRSGSGGTHLRIPVDAFRNGSKFVVLNKTCMSSCRDRRGNETPSDRPGGFGAWLECLSCERRWRADLEDLARFGCRVQPVLDVDVVAGVDGRGP